MFRKWLNSLLASGKHGKRIKRLDTIAGMLFVAALLSFIPGLVASSGSSAAPAAVNRVTVTTKCWPGRCPPWMYRGNRVHPHASAPVRWYTVRQGDSLSSISAHLLGSSKAWPRLWWPNRSKISDPAVIRIGQRLKIPDSSHVWGWLLRRANQAVAPVVSAPSSSSSSPVTPPPPSGSGCGLSGTLSYSQLEALWVCGGGPSWAEAPAASIAECESGGDQYAHNPSGASGYWQILGQVVPGDIYNPLVNAENAVSKFHASGDTFAQWVCQATATVKAHLMSTITRTTPRRYRAFSWAKAHMWHCPYVWGGNGPCHTGGYDCSGFVMRAYAAIGVYLPRTANDIAHSRKVYRISLPRKGDIVAWGWPYVTHVMLVAYKTHWVFGEHSQGTVSSVSRTYGAPIYLRVRHQYS